MRGTILVAADESPAGQAAIARAAEVAEHTGARAMVVYVRHARRAAGDAGRHLAAGAAAGELWSRFDGVRDRVWVSARRAFDPRGIEWELVVRTGTPAVEILRAADAAEADLIVMGRGRNREAGAPEAGWTARYVAARARARVLSADPGMPAASRRAAAACAG